MHAHLANVVALILFAGTAAQWLAWRFRIPAIVLLTATGFLLGPLTGQVRPQIEFGSLLEPFVQLAVAVILFEGGLNLHFHELVRAGGGVRRLVTLGLVFSFVLGTASAHLIGLLSLPVASVFGAIIVVTGPTVILPLLRQARLRARPASLLKWEGIVNDPLGAVLAVVVFEFLVTHGEDHGGLALVGTVLGTLGAAAALGWFAGGALGTCYRRGWFPEYLKGPAMLAMVLVTYALGNALLDEAGLLTVTALGLALGNANLPSIEELRRFKENISIVLVSGLFIVLTANLDLGLVRELDWHGAFLIALVVLVVRPVAVFLATLGTDLTWQERLLVGWIAPRGIVAAAVAGAFTTRMLEAGYPDAAKLLPLVFVLIVTTVVLHGFSLPWVARRLGQASPRADGLVIVGASPWAINLAERLRDLEIPVLVVDASWHRLRPARLAGVPIHFGQVVSESADAHLDLSAMGYVLAATDNDAYNALVCTRFSAEFNRSAVFQLPLPAADADERKGLAMSLRGQHVFADDALYEVLLQRYFEGWRFQKTRLTEEFDFATYRKRVGDSLFAALVVRQSGGLILNLERYKGAAGDTVINFLPPER
ncbi:MAG: sodium:proton antiporter [Gammaproteobacteria bacterium]|nr:sodium:proton antiporter [Gammaproteobacteria bacterium]MCP5200457.1 sodium:proton antiporter [Gammaproteobacteria bacterium]